MGQKEAPLEEAMHELEEERITVPLSNSISQSTIRLSTAINKLTDAFEKSAAASEKHARNLAYATWALVFATLVLAVITACSVL